MASLKQTADKTLRYLREKGLWETLKKAARHFGRKRDERRFVRRMQLTPEEMEQQRRTAFPDPLRFSVVVPLYNTPADVLREMIDSVCGQTYPDWELCLADGSDEAHAEVGAYCRRRAEAEPRIRYRKLEKNEGISGNSNACMDMASGEYIALLDHDDLLTSNALFEMRSAIAKTGADFLYSDEMVFRSPRVGKIIGIRVKPGFSPDTLLSNNYICHLTVFSRDLLGRVGGFRKQFDGSQDHDLILRLTDRAHGIAHISKVLYLWRSLPSSVAADINSKAYAISAGQKAVETFLREQKGIEASVESTEVFPTMYRVHYPIDGALRVRLILDARGEKEDVLKKIRTLQESAGWDSCAWTLIRTLEQMDLDGGAGQGSTKQEIRWMTPLAGESRSRMWNRAARESEEEYLLYVDGIPEAMETGWLRELLSHAQHDHVGAVGAKLHFQRGTVRHAGVVIGMGPEGVAGRPYFVEMQEREGYFGMIAVAEDVAAVTDLIMVSREKMALAGGFSEAYSDALFDVDLCLRLMEKGYYNVFTPYARMRMGKAKGLFVDVGREYASYPQDAEVFRKRNAQILANGDPYFNPNLSLKYEDWRIKRV